MTIPADPRAFLYGSTLDPDAALKLTAEALSRADDGELYLQYRKTEAFGFDDGVLSIRHSASPCRCIGPVKRASR